MPLLSQPRGHGHRLGVRDRPRISRAVSPSAPTEPCTSRKRGRPAPPSRLPNSARRPIRRWGRTTTGRPGASRASIGTATAPPSPRDFPPPSISSGMFRAWPISRSSAISSMPSSRAGGVPMARPDVPAGVARVNRSGSWTITADLSAFQSRQPGGQSRPSRRLRAGRLLVLADPPQEIIDCSGTESRGSSSDQSLDRRYQPHHRRLRHAGSYRAHGHRAARRCVLSRATSVCFPVVPGLEKVFRLSPFGCS